MHVAVVRNIRIVNNETVFDVEFVPQIIEQGITGVSLEFPKDVEIVDGLRVPVTLLRKSVKIQS